MAGGGGRASQLDYLKSLDTSRLLEHLQDGKFMRDTVRSNTKVQVLQRSKTVMLTSNRRLAELNLERKPYLSHSKLLLAEMYQILGHLVSSVTRKQKRLDVLQQSLSLRATHKLLKKKTNQSQHKSENIWLKFTEGKLQVTDFVEQLQASQKLYYTRLTQTEKIQNILSQEQMFAMRPRVVYPLLSPHLYTLRLQLPCLLPTHHSCRETCLLCLHKHGNCEPHLATYRWLNKKRHTALKPLDDTEAHLYQPKSSKNKKRGMISEDNLKSYRLFFSS